MKNLFSTLDLQYQSPSTQFPNVESYATQFAKQLKQSSAIIINGKPLIPTQNDSRLEFQKNWLLTPLTTHQLSSFDSHLIPGTGTFIINLTGKVRFDEGGKNRLGETSDLITLDSINNSMSIGNNQPQNQNKSRPIWGSWFGFNLSLVVDENQINNYEGQLINSFNYRFTYRPSDSIIQL